MAKRSAGLLLYRQVKHGLEVLLVHPGGPFWRSRDAGAWSIPKGEHSEGEDPAAAARREFTEETGAAPPSGLLIDLGEIRQKGGKVVRGFAAAGEFDVGALRCNVVEIVWPPRSGTRIVVPEVDEAAWFPLEAAREKILAAQADFLDRLVAALMDLPDVRQRR